MAAHGADSQEREDFCTLRGVPVNDGMGVNSCVNHPHHNRRGITTPIGPVFVSSLEMSWRYIAIQSPDSEEIRALLLSLLHGIKALPGYEYSNGFAFTPYVAIWQLGEFKDQRALDDLWRIAALDPSAGYGANRITELTILFAEDAILKILCQEAPDPIGDVHARPANQRQS
jgi:hypothetical protein